MTCYIVTFSVKTEAAKTKIKDRLKVYGYYCPIHDNCWAIKTDDKAMQILEAVRAVMDPSESLFVIRSGTEAAWVNSYGEKHTNWLKENL